MCLFFNIFFFFSRNNVIKKLMRTAKIQGKKILNDQMANNLDLVLVLDRQEVLLPVLAMAHLVAEV
jgi:hypothetical protein